MLNKRHLPSITALQCFEAATRHLSFTRAAEELNLTQSAVSKQVAQLEELLQHLLFPLRGVHVEGIAQLPHLLELRRCRRQNHAPKLGCRSGRHQ